MEVLFVTECPFNINEFREALAFDFSITIFFQHYLNVSGNFRITFQIPSI